MIEVENERRFNQEWGELRLRKNHREMKNCFRLKRFIQK